MIAYLPTLKRVDVMILSQLSTEQLYMHVQSSLVTNTDIRETVAFDPPSLSQDHILPKH